LNFEDCDSLACIETALSRCRPAHFFEGYSTIEGSIDFADYFVVPAKKGCQLVVLLDGSTDYWAGCAIRRRVCPSVAASRDDDPEGKGCSNDVIWKAPSCKHPR